MTAPPLSRAAFAVLGALLLLAGCAQSPALIEGNRLIAAGQPREGLAQLQQAMRDKPDDTEARAVYMRQRDALVARLLSDADEALRAGRLEEAQAGYREALALHPQNSRAPAGLAAVETARQNLDLLGKASADLAREDAEAARAWLRAILARVPEHAEARALLARADVVAGRARDAEPQQLAAALRRPVNLEFRDAPLRSVFDALSRQADLNIVFDKDVRLDQKTTLFARSTSIVDALDMVLVTNQLARKVLNPNTLLIYPNIPAKQRDYQDMVVRAFFLANADAKQTLTLLKTMARIRDVHVDEKLNLVMVRDTPEAVRLAERLVRLADRPEPEVMLEVEILEVKRSKLTELGVQWPTQLGVPNITKTPLLAPNAQGVQVPTGATVDSLSVLPLNVRKLRELGWGDLTVTPSPTINLRKNDSDVKLLANPRIRVRNREKAKIHIGDKVPVITANTTATGVVSESVAYLDVGLKLDVEPQVHLEGDVAIKVSMEVSNIVREVKSATGTLTYQLGSRNASTVLRLRDGETQVLAGLISDEERGGASRVPGLGDLPLIGRLFSAHRDERNKTEIVLLITPRVLRNIERPSLDEAEFFAGTEATVSTQPLRLRPARNLPRAVALPAPTAGLMMQRPGLPAEPPEGSEEDDPAAVEALP